MSAFAIRLQALGKSYAIRSHYDGRLRYGSLRDSLSGAVRGLFRRGKQYDFEKSELFWALREVCFFPRCGTEKFWASSGATVQARARS